ncbi:MAG: ComF family protein [Alphaproteobacteria bacterium]
MRIGWQKIAPLGLMLADALLPPRCLATGEVVDRQGQLSAGAWSAINFITQPLCQCCGLPFAFGSEEDAELSCGACLAEPPDYDRARAVIQYDDASRAMILAFKHGDRMEGAPAFAAWMARAGADLLDDADLIVPVPLHRKGCFAGAIINLPCWPWRWPGIARKWLRWMRWCVPGTPRRWAASAVKRACEICGGLSLCVLAAKPCWLGVRSC